MGVHQFQGKRKTASPCFQRLAACVGLVGLEPMTPTMSSDLETLENTAFASCFVCSIARKQNGDSVLFLY